MLLVSRPPLADFASRGRDRNRLRGWLSLSLLPCGDFILSRDLGRRATAPKASIFQTLIVAVSHFVDRLVAEVAEVAGSAVVATLLVTVPAVAQTSL